MANNTGLSFNPAAGINNQIQKQLGYTLPLGNKQSVPTTAQDYYNPIIPSLPSSPKKNQGANIVRNPLMELFKSQTAAPKRNPYTNIDWGDSRTVFNLPSIIQADDEQESFVRNPLKILQYLTPENVFDYNLNVWNEGLKGLPNSRKEIWEQENAEKIADKDDEWKDRLWRNQQFVNVFGREKFDEMAGQKEARDSLYYDYVTKDAILKKYGRDSDINDLLSLTPKGRDELIKSGYKNDFELQQQDDKDENKGWYDYSLGERTNAITSKTYQYGMSGLGTGSIIGSVVPGVGTAAGAVIGGLSGSLTGFLEGVAHPEDAGDINKAQKRADNEEIFNKIRTADNDRMKKDSADDINDLTAKYYQAYAQGEITDDDINKMFDDTALSGKKTYTDELGRTQEYDYAGSNYYSAFKDSDEFEHFNTRDKLKYLAQTQVLASKYGQNSAISALDQDMQKYVSDNQSGWEWGANTVKNTIVGGVSNLMMKVVGLGALAAKIGYGSQGLANFLEGKDASGSGEENSVMDAQYWNKVDQYNTFDSDEIARADKNGGISKYNNVVTPGTEDDFFSWNTLNEALRMSKFAWSDALVNLSLGKLTKVATKLAGGVELAPGVLASESSLASKAINKIGSAGTLGASSLGIDAAYGMQTYNDVLDKNNAKINQIISQDTDAEVAKRVNTPEEKEKFQAAVDAENARRKAASEDGKWIPVDRNKAWEAWVAGIKDEVTKQQQQAHAEDLNEAKKAAADAYVADATIEGARMTGVNGVFRNYLFDKGTLNALRLNNPYVNVTTKNGLYALGKNATRKKAMSILGNNIWGGFHSNYFDDVTVGFAEGLGIQDYNNYLLQKYNPAAYGSVLDDYVNPLVAGMAGAVDAMESRRAFMDGAIGALGTVFTVSPNIGRRTRKSWAKEAEAAKKRGEKYSAPSWGENMFLTNPIIQAYTEAKRATNLTENEINRVNDIIKENGYSLDNMVETISALNQAAIAKQGTSVMEAKDAKDKEAFALASSLLSLRNSGVTANAQVEPNKAKWSTKKRIANNISQGLNQLLGVQMFDDAESQYTKAMQTLQDASTLGEDVDDATYQRQQELVKTFLGIDANKSVTEGMSEGEKTKFAVERLKKNANSLLDTIDKTDKIQRKFEKSYQANLHPDLKQQLMYQYVLDGRWKDRLAELESTITSGNSEAEDASGSTQAIKADDIDELISDRRKDRKVIAKYGTTEGWEREHKAQEKRVEEAQKAYDKAKEESKKGDDPTQDFLTNNILKAQRYAREKAAKQKLKMEKESLKDINSDKDALTQATTRERPFLSAEEILNLDADDRFRMLDDYHRNDYSQWQQKEIDRAKTMLMKDGKDINAAMQDVKDAAVLTHRIEDNMEVARKIMSNPAQANMLQQALEQNRRKKVVDYFNDKVVAEAYRDFITDPTATLNEENVVKKARTLSSSVLNGIQKMAMEEMRSQKRQSGLRDKSLQDIIDGTNKVLKERGERMKESLDISDFVHKTKEVDHKQVDKHEASGTDGNKVDFEVETTVKQELSNNDKQLVDLALDYAAEKEIPIENLKDAVGTEDFQNYVAERNHSYQMAMNPLTRNAVAVNVGTVENMVNPVSTDYMQTLVQDVLNAYDNHKSDVKKATETKKTSSAPKSVATAPVETKGAREEGELRPDDKEATDDIFGLKNKSKESKEGEGNNTKPTTAFPDVKNSIKTGSGETVKGTYKDTVDNGSHYIQFEGDKQAQRSIGKDELEKNGVSVEDILGDRKNWADEKAYDKEKNDFESLKIDSANIKPDGSVSLITNHGVVEGNAASKLLSMAFPEYKIGQPSKTTTENSSNSKPSIVGQSSNKYNNHWGFGGDGIATSRPSDGSNIKSDDEGNFVPATDINNLKAANGLTSFFKIKYNGNTLKEATGYRVVEEGKLEDAGNGIMTVKKKCVIELTGPNSKPEEGAHHYDNGGILNNAMVINSKIVDELSSLLKEIDKREMNDRTRDKLKEIIDTLVQNKAYDSVKQLQSDLYAEALLTNAGEAPGISTVASGLTAFNAAKAAEKSTSTTTKAEEDNAETSPLLTKSPTTLETVDLDTFLTNPKFKAIADYINTHGMVSFIQKLSEAWNKEAKAFNETGKQGNLHQARVVFLYDPALANQVRESIEKNGGQYVASISAPVIMALEITDRTGTKALVEDESQLIKAKDGTNDKENKPNVKLYQPLGIMPANDNSHMESASRMSELRDCIDFDSNSGEVQVLRYAGSKGKHNGSAVSSNITDVQSHTEDESRPVSGKDVPAKGVRQLMDENSESPSETFVKSTQEEQDEYNEAKQSGNMARVRRTSLYKKLRSAFLSRLSKVAKEAPNPEDPDRKVMQFSLQKGTHDSFPKEVRTKKISESNDRNTGRPIVNILREVDDSGDNAEEVIESNSRFKRLFSGLEKLSLPKGLFNKDGSIANKAFYDKALEDFSDTVSKIISRNLNVVDMNVTTEIEDTDNGKIIRVNVNSGNTKLSTLSIAYGNKMSKADFASFIKDLILDANGNTRPSPRSAAYEMVKWQVNYEDAKRMQDKDLSAEDRNYARRNLEDLYDDDVLTMNVTKLAYPVRSVSVGINPAMRSKLYSTETSAPEKANIVTEQHPASETSTKDDEKVDSDTGMQDGTGNDDSGKSELLAKIQNTIHNMLAKSKEIVLSSDGKHYTKAGQLWSRVTSIKYTMKGMHGRFNPNNAWAKPSTSIGNSADDFSRDTFNGVFDSMDDSQRNTAFGDYANSTEKNYEEVYKDLKAFQARLAAKGQTIIVTGTREDPGHITASGLLDVQYKDKQGNIKTTQIRVAGTIDALAVDSNGHYHLYDFKTHRSATFGKQDAIDKGYDRQLNMYAKLLEQEFGIKIDSINIIPIKADYPTPSGMDNDGHPVQGAQATYRSIREGSNQLEYKPVNADDSKYVPYTKANFKVEKEFSLDRLDDSELIASYDKMTDDEKASLVEAIQDQSNDNSDVPDSIDDIKSAVPEGTDNTEQKTSFDDEAGGDVFPEDFNIFGTDDSEGSDDGKADTSAEGTADSIDNTSGLKADEREHEEACRGPKP